jgi:TolB-like protein
MIHSGSEALLEGEAMRRAIGILAIVFLFMGRGFAQSPPASQPTTSEASEASQSEPKPVLILPFVMPSNARFKDAGQSIQQDLANAISPELRGRMVAPPTARPADDAAAALASGREMHAAAVVFGRAQVNGDQIRLSGQVFDVESGKSLGSLKESGRAEELFRLEDELLPQVVAALPEPLLNLRGLLTTRQSQPPRIIYLPGDVATRALSNGPIDGGYPGPISSPYVLPPPPGGPPPYSPTAGAYPYRFYSPYSQLFSYDYDPDPFLPIYGGFDSDRFAARGGQRPAQAGIHEARPAHRR